MNEINVSNPTYAIQVVGLSMPDPNLLEICSSEQFPAVVDGFIKNQDLVEAEKLKIKNLEAKIADKKRELRDYEESVKEAMTVRMKQLKKTQTPEGVQLTLKTNSSVEIKDMEKLPGSCIKLVKSPDKTVIKTMIELGEISPEAAVISNSYSVTVKKPKE